MAQVPLAVSLGVQLLLHFGAASSAVCVVSLAQPLHVIPRQSNDDGFAMQQRISKVRRILNGWAGGAANSVAVEPDFDRRTSPDARMNLLLRFATEAGPRTIIASGIPLALASDIAREMEKAGHYAQFVDELPSLSLAERVRRRKAEKQANTKRKHSALTVVQVGSAS